MDNLWLLEYEFQYMLLLRGATGSTAIIGLSDGFQYMLLLRGATYTYRYREACMKFQYMLLLRGATGSTEADI